jgi:hypothetical protein
MKNFNDFLESALLKDALDKTEDFQLDPPDQDALRIAFDYITPRILECIKAYHVWVAEIE